MKRILVPTDFSENALKAALYAGGIARKANAGLYLLHVIESIDQKVHQPFPLHERYLTETLKMRTTEIECVRSTLLNSYPEIIIENAIKSGNIRETINDFAKKNAIDLIIMGTKGATGLKELFAGSVTSGIVSHSKLPVLAVPANYRIEEPDGILHATKHFEKDITLLKPVIELAKLFSAKIFVAVFVEKGRADAANYMADTHNLYDYIDFLKNTFSGVDFQGELIEGNDFEETVEEYDKKNKLDIISMITYPKSLVEKLFKGSATRKMAFHSQIPVLAIPAGNVNQEAPAT